MATNSQDVVHVEGAVSFGMPPHEVPKWQDLNSRIVPHHAVRWRNIGIELGLVPSLLDTIAENCAVKPQRSQECLTAVLEKWSMLDGPKATWNKLEHVITNVQRAELGLYPLELKESSLMAEEIPVVNFTNCEDVNECFSHFTAAMFKILSKAEFPLLRRACLENSNIFGGVALPSDLKNKIANAQNLNKLFDVLCDSPYWNWMNIKMLTKMANASHLDAATKLIQQYKDEVYSRKLINFLEHIPNFNVSSTYYTKAKEKWNKNLNDITVNDLVNHWSEVEKIFNVEGPTVLLDSLINGSIEIHWLIPTELVEDIRQSISNQISIMLSCDILQFDIEGHVIKHPSIAQPEIPSIPNKLSMVASLSTPGVDPSELTQSVTKLSIAELSDTGYESTTDSMTKDSLIEAAEEGNVGTLQYLTQERKYHVDTRGSPCHPYWSGTLLFISCYNGNTEAVETLLQLGADINAVNMFRRTALHAAAEQNSVDVVNMLLMNCSALIKQTDGGGWTALHIAAKHNNADVVNVLLKNDPTLTKQTDIIGRTALHIAALLNSVDVVDMLLMEDSTLIMETDRAGNTPLDEAVMHNNSAVVWTMVHNHKVDITHCKQLLKLHKLLANEETRRQVISEKKQQDSSPFSGGGTGVSTQGADIKLKVFTENYTKLTSVLPTKNLTNHLVKENVINIEDEEKILRAVGQSRATSIVLRKIRNSLEAQSTESFDTLMSIMEQYGDPLCIELVSEMRQNLSQNITVQHISSSQDTDVSTKSSTKKYKPSHAD